MIPIIVNGDISPKIADEPRFSSSQLDAMRRIIKTFPDATITGLDQRMRPVIQYRPSDGKLVKYSLLRNGDPTKPRLPYLEVWG
jgi:hypothetical protein